MGEMGRGETGRTTLLDELRRESVAEMLATVRGEGDTVRELAHDVRNIVTALGLYCDLLEEPGVLTPRAQHYARELRVLAGGTRRLAEKIGYLDRMVGSLLSVGQSAAGERAISQPDLGHAPIARPVSSGTAREASIDDFAGEVESNLRLLQAIAGAGMIIRLRIEGGAKPMSMNREDLIRILAHLVKSASEALAGKGEVRIKVGEAEDRPGWLLLAVEADGPGASGSAGIPGEFVRWTVADQAQSDPGTSACYALIGRAGGRMRAGQSAGGGARIEIQLPVSEGPEFCTGAAADPGQSE